MTSNTWRRALSAIAIYAVLTSSACARGGGPEAEPPPPPTPEPALIAGFIAICRDSALELNLPAVAAGTCLTDLQNASGDQWPGPHISPVDGVSDGFRAASGVVQTWTAKGWVNIADGDSAVKVVMSNMNAQRNIFEDNPSR